MTHERRRGYRIEIQGPPKSTTGNKELSSDSRTLAAESDEKEVLLIDEKIVPYLKTPEGYRIYFQPPAADLLEAARSYVDTQPEKPE